VDCATIPAPSECGSDAGPSFCGRGQDAQYGWDTTHETIERYFRDTSFAAEPVVVDNVTGLVWQGCVMGLSGNSCEDGVATTHDWQESVTQCDSLSWGGHTGWRLPDEFELLSIADHGKSMAPFIDEIAFPATPAGWFWTSSSTPDTSWAWTVVLEWGSVRKGLKIYDDNVRCVRGLPTPHPEPRFFRDTSFVSQPVVFDSYTSLMWQGCARGLSGSNCTVGSAAGTDWENALSYCDVLSWGGHSDWRLPSSFELRSIVNNCTESPTIEPGAFPGTPSDVYWTSSSDAAFPTAAWRVDFTIGELSQYGVSKGDSSRSRCVRGEP